MLTGWYRFGDDWDEGCLLTLAWAILGPLGMFSIIGVIATLGRSRDWCETAIGFSGALALMSVGAGLHRRGRVKWRAVAGVIAVTWMNLAVFMLRHASQPAFGASLAWRQAMWLGLGMLALLYATMEVAMEGVRKAEAGARAEEEVGAEEGKDEGEGV